ncbi:ferric reductase-like transmembrane domain-containing protein [Azovibrio restrictus]|uniref:ferredoxin reductase family protein n=1 Tax=Azovibrio restrictus TaxID=146938 RepID=UPI0026F2332D|nr:ferric reductase-like transmembrane domain-containing protein [Azovibrio restrictus]
MKTLSHTTFLGGFTALLVLAWGANLRYGAGLPAGDTLWVIRAETLNLSGLLAVGLMSLIMVLATRPAWLEKPLGGMDRIYRTHKWAGILAGIAVLVHWAADEAGGPIRNLIGRSGKVAREHGPELYESLHHLGKDVGEWALYPLLGLILLTLLRWFPFKPWRLLHRAMPVLYLMGAFHGLLLAPLAWWQQPLGWLMALLIAAGSWGAVLSLLGRIGRHRQYRGEILQVEEPAPGLTTLTCRLESRWPGHRAGQFVFLTLHDREGSHPFTIASAPREDGTLTFAIKALGDYTRNLAARLRPGQTVCVEGPYGCFDFQGEKPQVWIAGGVGITPFLAGLEALGQAPHTPVSLHYCSRDLARDPFATQLQTLATGLPGVRLQLHDTGQEGPLTVKKLLQQEPQLAGSDLWFCGPAGFARSLRNGLKAQGLSHVPFHQEAFEMR